MELNWRRSTWNKRLLALAVVVLLGGLTAAIFAKVGFSDASNAAAFDLAGGKIHPLRSIEGKAVVFVFLSVDCPISNQYAPEIQRLDATFGREGIKFWLVYPNADESSEIVRKHTQEYLYHAGVLRDPEHALVKISQARVTPEAAVFLPGGKLIYHGEIDDRYVDFGVERRQPTRHNLAEILSALVEGKQIKPTSTKAVGCPL